MDDKKKIFVYGAGISGQGVAEVLAQKGSAVILYNDDKKDLDPVWLKAFEAICSLSLPGSPLLRKR